MKSVLYPAMPEDVARMAAHALVRMHGASMSWQPVLDTTREYALEVEQAL